MNKYLNQTVALFTIIFFSTNVFAQITIYGNIREKNKSSVGFANILLFKKGDSSFINNSVSNGNGSFQIRKIQNGVYKITVRKIGYQPKDVYFTVNSEKSDSLFLDTIYVEQSIVDLHEIKVVSKKAIFEQGVDRLTINVGNSITASGSSVLDVLESSPGVIVNRQNNAISFAGKDGVLIAIDNKITRMPLNAAIQMLQGMNSDQVKTIELITNPPASFDAEGSAGIINIILKKNENYGTNIAYSAFGGYGRGMKTGGDFSINYRASKFNLFSSYNINYDKFKEYWTNFRENQFQNQDFQIATTSTRIPDILNNTARLGIDYLISNQITLGVDISGYVNNWDMSAANNVKIKQADSLAYIITNDKETNRWQNFTSNFDIKYKLKKGDELRFNYAYLYYLDNNPHNYSNDYENKDLEIVSAEQITIQKNTPINISVFSSDYTKTVNSNINFGLGVKGTISHFTNDINVNQFQGDSIHPNPSLSGNEDLLEKITAGYAFAKLKFPGKIALNVGLRYEHTSSLINDENHTILMDKKYNDFFPDLLFSKDINENHSFVLSYNERITRPSFQDLAPFVVFLDPYTFFTGNVHLQPTLTKIFKLEFRSWSDILSIEYSHDAHPIVGYQPQINRETNLELIVAENFKSRDNLNFIATLPIQIKNWWTSQNTVVYNYQKVNTTVNNIDIAASINSIRINSIQTFLFKNDYAVELAVYYQSPFLLGITKQSAPGAVNFGIQKKFKNNSTVKLAANDLFHTNTWRITGNYSTIDLNTIRTYDFETRFVRVTYSRTIGNKKIKVYNIDNSNIKDEQRRVN